jgi:uncharacterized membrane protein (UPF0182 family)
MVVPMFLLVQVGSFDFSFDSSFFLICSLVISLSFHHRFCTLDSNSATSSGDQHYGQREIAGFVIGGFFLLVIAVIIFAVYAVYVVPRAKRDVEGASYSDVKTLEMASN